MRPRGTMALLSIVSLCLSGCWSSRELEESAIVAGAGFDKGNPSGHLITVQIVQPAKLTPKVRGTADRAVYFEQATGQTTFEAIRNFTHESSRKLFWSHCQIFVLSANLGPEGVTGTLNWFYRNQELRPLAYIAMSDSTAQDILKVNAVLRPEPAYQRADEILVMTDASTAPIVHLKDFMEMTARPERAAYLPTLKAVSLDTVTSTGTGVFFRDQFVGKLNLDESRGLLSLTGHVRSGTIVIPTRGQAQATLEIIKETVRKEIRYSQGRPGVLYHIRCVADVADDPGETAHSPQIIEEMEKSAAQDICTKSIQCIQRVQSYHADIIEAGKVLERRDPQRWHKLKSHWDKTFTTLPIQVDATVHIRHEGLIKART